MSTRQKYICFVWFSAMLFLSPGFAAERSSVQLGKLRCEYLVNPLGVDVNVPRLSWQLQDTEATRGQKQTAYHVIVASRPELLDQNRGDLWDSGKVESAQSALVSYGGTALQSNQECHWKVRVFDKDGICSEWSSPARFSMGLLSPDDWTAAWILHPQMPSREKAKGQGLDVTKAVASRISGDRLTVTANPKVSGGVDPAHGIYKKLIVTYVADGKEHTAAVIDGHTLDVSGRNLSVVRGVYGDYDVPVLDLTDMVRKKLTGNSVDMRISLNELTFGQEMGRGKAMCLRARYRVGGRPFQRQVELGGTLKLPATGDGSGKLVIDSVVLGDLNAEPLAATQFPVTSLGHDLPETQHLWFRKRLELEAPARSALMHVASMGYHELYVNGKKADDRVLSPALTRLDKRVLYVTYDIADLLQEGDNVIALWTGPGWSRYATFRTYQALRAQISGVDDDGHAFSLATGGDWRCHPANSKNRGHIRYKNHGGEVLDARAYEEGWNLPGFDDRAWPFASERRIDVELSAQMMEPTRVIETIPAQRVSGDGPYRVDLGKNFTGWLEIKIRQQQPGDRIQIKVADDAETIQDFGQLNEYICKGQGEETFRNRFNYIAGRYVTLEGLKKKPERGDVVGLALATDFVRIGSFDSSMQLFNDIYEADLWTYRANTVEGFTMDCPHRERLGYGEVAFATAWGIGLPDYDSAAVYMKHIRDWSDVQEENGWIHHTAPQINRHFGGPMWSSAGLNVADVFYDYYGDPQAFERIFPAAERWLAFLHERVEDGLLRPIFGTEKRGDSGRFLGDWAAPGERKEFGDTEGALYFNNCVYAKNLQDVIRMARRLDRVENVALYEQRLSELRTRIQGRFYNTETGEYVTGTPVQQAFALMVGVTPESLKDKVFGQLANDIKEKNYIDMGSSGLPVLLKFLIDDVQRGEILFDALASTTRPSYGYFLARGESTWPEYWSVDVPSKIHTCYTGIASWMTKSLAGIRPDPSTPGFRSFIIQPVPAGDLRYAEAATESLYGPIRSRWERDENEFVLKVTIPPNSQATVYLPTDHPASVTENGTPLQDAAGVTLVRFEAGRAVLGVDSGSYVFKAFLH